jgi:hypothetical protein
MQQQYSHWYWLRRIQLWIWITYPSICFIIR